MAMQSEIPKPTNNTMFHDLDHAISQATKVAEEALQRKKPVPVWASNTLRDHSGHNERTASTWTAIVNGEIQAQRAASMEPKPTEKEDTTVSLAGFRFTKMLAPLRRVVLRRAF